MEWIDTCCRGGSARNHRSGVPTTDQLRTELSRLKINQALVHSAWPDHIAPEYANEQLFADLADHEELLSVPEILPEGGDRFLDQPGSEIKDLVHRGGEYLVRRIGSEQLLFDTNLPVSDGGALIAGIACAAISTSDRETIVSGNVKRLLTEVRRDG